MSLLPIDSIDIGERFRRDMGDLPALAASIDRVGLLHPVVVAEQDGRVVLVAGERRLRACRDILRWERIPIRMLPPIESLLEAERDENEVRLDFAPSEAVAIAAALRPIEEAAARDRQGHRTDVAGEPPANVARSRDRIAAAVGMGRTTLARAEAVVEAAAENPALAPLVEVMDETGRIAPVHAALRSLPPDPAPAAIAAAVETVRAPRPRPAAPPRDPSRPPADATRRIARAHLFEALQSARGNADLAHPLTDEDRQQVAIHLDYIRWRCLGDAPALREVSDGS